MLQFLKAFIFGFLCFLLLLFKMVGVLWQIVNFFGYLLHVYVVHARLMLHEVQLGVLDHRCRQQLLDIL